MQQLYCRTGPLVFLIGALCIATAQADTINISHGSTSFDMEFVTVGNDGNAAHSTGYGAVGYEYNIGKYEVTADQWVAAMGYSAAWTGTQPVGNVGWDEAAQFCNWLTTGDPSQGYYDIDSATGAATANALSHDAYATANGTTYFLPTEDEWTKAGYYNPNTGAYTTYAGTGENIPEGPGFRADGSFDAVASWVDLYGPSNTLTGPYDVTNSGVASAYGTVGQMGNLREWTETPGTSSVSCYNSSTFYMGGGLFPGMPSQGYEGMAIGAFRTEPGYQNDTFGFRIASVTGTSDPGGNGGTIPEPASVLVWFGLGIVGFTGWRRRR